jgi:hypothetical protein
VVTRREALVAAAALFAGCGASPRAPSDGRLLARVDAARRDASCCWAEGRERALSVALDVLPQLRSPAARRRVAGFVAEDAARLAELRLDAREDPIPDAFGGIR